MKSIKATKNIVIFGVNVLTLQMLDILECNQSLNIIGIIALTEPDNRIKSLITLPIYKGFSTFIDLQNRVNITAGIISISAINEKKALVETILKHNKNFEFENVIHPSVVFGKNVSMGQGNYIGANAILNSDSKVGSFCVLKDKVSLGHDSCIENFVHIGTNATIGGNVSIGAYSHLSACTNIINDVSIGKHCNTFNKALILKNLDDFTSVE